MDGIWLRITSTGSTGTTLLLSDIEDGTTSSSTLRPGPVYVPDGATVNVAFTTSVALSYEVGVLRGFITQGALTAEFVFGTPFLASLPQEYASWAFRDRGVGGGVAYLAGFYEMGATAWLPSGGPQTHGTADVSYAAHAFVVLGGASSDMIIRVTGTSITDGAVRVLGDTQDIDTSGGVLNEYKETSKKWLGQVTFTLLSGTAVSVNYGFSKYWDNGNTDFVLGGLEVLGVAAKSSAGFDVSLICHNAVGWTYNAGAEPTPPIVATMSTDHGDERKLAANQHFAWKRTDLEIRVNGGDGEGVLVQVTTASNNELDFLTASISYNKM